MDNRLIAQTLLSNQLATEDVLRNYWGEISADKDIAKILVENGLLDENLYSQLIQFVQDLANQQGASAKESNSTSKPTVDATVNPTSNPTTHSADHFHSSAVTSHASEKSTSEGPHASSGGGDGFESLPLMGNQGFLEDTAAQSPAQPTTQDMGQEPIEGLESTYLSDYGLQLSHKAEKEVSAPAITTPTKDVPNRAPQPFVQKLPLVEHGERGDGELKTKRVQSVDDATTLDEILIVARVHTVSDIMLDVNRPICFNRFGQLHGVSKAVLSADDVEQFIKPILDNNVYTELTKTSSIIFGYALAGAGRFRISVVLTTNGWSVHIRCVTLQIPAPSALGLPQNASDLVLGGKGLVLVCSPAGGGKSTTLFTLANEYNRQRQGMILVLGRPLESILVPKRSLITHREIGVHARDRVSAVRAAMDQGVSVLVLDDLAGQELFELALQAAASGILVLASVAADDSFHALSRLLGSISPSVRGLYLEMLAAQLRGTIAQHLLPRVDNKGVVAAFECIQVSNIIASRIRSGNLMQLHSEINSGRNSGIVSLDNSLQKLFKAGVVAESEIKLITQRLFNQRSGA